MSIRIITDSAADIDQNELEGLIILPMTITFDGVSYRDGIDINKQDFFKMLETSESMPITSLVSPAAFEDAYKQITADGDEAIVLTISSELSGTYQSATIAAEDYPNVSVLDTRSATLSERVCVLRCMELIKAGLSRDEILTKLGEEIERVVIFGVVDTLKYLQKGGRISSSSALVGGIIGIKPVLTIEEGKIIGIGKARGSKKSNQFLNEKIEECGGIDFGLPFSAGYTGSDDANLLQYLESNKEILDKAPHEIEVVQAGSTVGTHAGPGAVLVAFFKNPKS